MMGALRWDSRDARTCIENRFTLFARFLQIAEGRAGTWSQPGLIAEVRLNPCAEQVLRAPPAFQARIRRCRAFVRRDLFVRPRAGEEKQGVSGYCFT